MRRLSFSGFLLSLLVVLVPARMAFAETPLNALILTTQGVRSDVLAPFLLGNFHISGCHFAVLDRLAQDTSVEIFL